MSIRPCIVPAHSPSTTTVTSLCCNLRICGWQRSSSAATAWASLWPGAGSASAPLYQPETQTKPNSASRALSAGPSAGNLEPSSKPAQPISAPSRRAASRAREADQADLGEPGFERRAVGGKLVAQLEAGIADLGAFPERGFERGFTAQRRQVV